MGFLRMNQKGFHMLIYIIVISYLLLGTPPSSSTHSFFFFRKKEAKAQSKQREGKKIANESQANSIKNAFKFTSNKNNNCWR